MLDGDEAVSGAGTEGEAVTYRIDLDAPAVETAAAPETDSAGASSPGTPAAGASAPASPSPAPAADAELRARVEAAERRSLAAESLVAPFLQHLTQQAAPQGPRVPTREQLLTDPSVTTQDLLTYLERQQSETQTRAAQMAQIEARRGASELYARGVLTPEAMGGATEAFDAMRERYVRPLYEQMPVMRDVIHALFPDQPSMGEFAVAWVRRIAEMAQNDPAGTYRKLADFARGGAPAAARQVTTAIADAARRGADRVAPGSGVPGPNSRARNVGAAEIRNMSDAEFERLDQQYTGGL